MLNWGSILFFPTMNRAIVTLFTFHAQKLPLTLVKCDILCLIRERTTLTSLSVHHNLRSRRSSADWMLLNYLSNLTNLIPGVFVTNCTWGQGKQRAGHKQTATCTLLFHFIIWYEEISPKRNVKKQCKCWVCGSKHQKQSITEGWH